MAETQVQTQTQKTILAVAVLCVAVLVPFLLLGKAVFERHQGHVWQVSIDGYDPRDILRGHYLRYVYAWNMRDDGISRCDPGQAQCCLCLNEQRPGDRVDPFARIVACDSPQANQCDSMVIPARGEGLPGRRGDIYYIPQKHAARLERALLDDTHDFKMEIAVPRNGGTAIIRNLYVDGKRLDRFLSSTP